MVSGTVELEDRGSVLSSYDELPVWELETITTLDPGESATSSTFSDTGALADFVTTASFPQAVPVSVVMSSILILPCR